MVAIAAIMVALAAILKMAVKMTAILKSHWSRSHSSKKTLNINFLCNWSIGALRNLLCVLATILKISAKMATIIIILGISSLSSKMGKISKCYNFKENLYLEDFLPEECDSDKCDLKMAAIAAIMVAILAAIFNMVAKTHKTFQHYHIPQVENLLNINFRI
jgi:flagellar biosynthesis protein FlhB